MNTTVPFELAKLLKEKGLDEETAHYYTSEGELFFDTDFPSLLSTKPRVWFPAPTIAEVVMWLYEKHGVWIEICVDWDGDFLYKIKSSSLPDAKIGKWPCESSLGIFDSPTLAYLSAIEYVLKNLV